MVPKAWNHSCGSQQHWCLQATSPMPVQKVQLVVRPQEPLVLRWISQGWSGQLYSSLLLLMQYKAAALFQRISPLVALSGRDALEGVFIITPFQKRYWDSQVQTLTPSRLETQYPWYSTSYHLGFTYQFHGTETGDNFQKGLKSRPLLKIFRKTRQCNVYKFEIKRRTFRDSWVEWNTFDVHWGFKSIFL